MNDGIYYIDFLYSGTNTLLIKKDAIIKLSNESFKVLKDTNISKEGYNKLTVSKTFSYYDFEVPIFTKEGDCVFDLKDLEIEVTNVSVYIPKNLRVISIQNDENYLENDLSFLERGKSILQSLGYNNNKKIEIELKKDSRIKDLHFKNESGLTTITIFPYDLEKVDEIIKYAYEVVKYYQNSLIEITKPNLLKINIFGVYQQLENTSNKDIIINEFNTEIKKYLSNALINNSIYREDIIGALKKIIHKYDISNNLNINLIHLNTDYFLGNNYENKIMTEEIDDFLELPKNALISFGSLS